MGKLPRLTGKEMLRFLERQGFGILRVKGSHHLLGKGDEPQNTPQGAGAWQQESQDRHPAEYFAVHRDDTGGV